MRRPDRASRLVERFVNSHKVISVSCSSETGAVARTHRYGASPRTCNGLTKRSTSDDAAHAPKPELPGWTNAEPRFVHSLKWFDQDGIEHMHVVRSDDLDDVLRQVRTVKAFIAASKVGAEKSVQADSAHSESQAEPEQAESAYSELEPEGDDYCPTHGRAKLRPSKYGGVFCSARMRNGEYCKFSSKRGEK
jgi:hypothetical protein